MFQFFQRPVRHYTLESDVYRRRILTYKDGPRAERVKEGEILEQSTRKTILVSGRNYVKKSGSLVDCGD